MQVHMMRRLAIVSVTFRLETKITRTGGLDKHIFCLVLYCFVLFCLVWFCFVLLYMFVFISYLLLYLLFLSHPQSIYILNRFIFIYSDIVILVRLIIITNGRINVIADIIAFSREVFIFYVLFHLLIVRNTFLFLDLMFIVFSV